jgi:hypothetical protein
MHTGCFSGWAQRAAILPEAVLQGLTATHKVIRQVVKEIKHICINDIQYQSTFYVWNKRETHSSKAPCPSQSSKNKIRGKGEANNKKERGGGGITSQK